MRGWKSMLWPTGAVFCNWSAGKSEVGVFWMVSITHFRMSAYVLPDLTATLEVVGLRQLKFPIGRKDQYPGVRSSSCQSSNCHVAPFSRVNGVYDPFDFIEERTRNRKYHLYDQGLKMTGLSWAEVDAPSWLGRSFWDKTNKVPSQLSPNEARIYAY